MQERSSHGWHGAAQKVSKGESAESTLTSTRSESDPSVARGAALDAFFRAPPDPSVQVIAINHQATEQNQGSLRELFGIEVRYPCKAGQESGRKGLSLTGGEAADVPLRTRSTT